eukprot:XP_016664199.1 PREDICTED: uncharacterized protein LOC107885198 [Acyrthosiphon pisum]
MDELEHEEQTSAAVESPVTQGTRVSEENIPEVVKVASTSKESDTVINCCMCSMIINKSDLHQHIKTTHLTDTVESIDEQKREDQTSVAVEYPVPQVEIMDELEHEEQTSAAVESPVTQGTRVSEENIPEVVKVASTSKESDTVINCCMCSMIINKSCIINTFSKFSFKDHPNVQYDNQ